MSPLENAYALVIGIGDPHLDTGMDVRAVYDILIDETLSCYKKENVILVSGENSTREDIFNGFNKLQEITDKNSSIFLYYSGHGGYYDGHYFIQAYGIYDGISGEELKEKWVTDEEIKAKLNELTSKRLIFFLDCCHAAGLTQGFTRLSGTSVNAKSGVVIDKEEIRDGLGQKIDNERGVSIVSSCREDQQSFQPEGYNSFFTQSLIEALKGEHRDSFKEAFIRIMEVSGYLQYKVPALAEENGVQQNPYVNLQMYDNFVLSYVPEGVRKEINFDTKSENIKPESKQLKEVVTSFRESENANNLVLFIHGFSGESAGTFGKIPSFLMEDERMKGWDLKPLGYTENVQPSMGKNIWGAVEDIEKIANYLKTCFKYKFDKYDRIAIVAHSLGGLIVQKALNDLQPELRTKLSHLILFGSPNNGIESDQQETMHLASSGNFIKALRKQWSENFKNPEFNLKVVAGTKDEYVSLKSNFDAFSEEYHEVVEGKHFTMVQPDDIYNDSYQLIVNTLTGNQFTNAYTSAEDINITLGKYDGVIKKLLPKVAELDDAHLTKLVLSLEASDRQDEAIQLLTERVESTQNPDIMGVMGGQYKRSYLFNHNASLGQKSYDYYLKGLEMAEKNKINSQIYYQAINLAFLSCVYKNDEFQMEQFAQKALDAANACRDNFWKIATVAEANLYLNRMDACKENYEKAASMTGVRDKISMYTNASKAYSHLMNTTDSEDDFMKFLKETLLN